MAAVDFAELIMEENPIFEGAVATPVTGPNRLATEKLHLPVQNARIAPHPAHLDRSDELRNILGAVPKLIDSFAPAGDISVRGYIKALMWLLELAGFKGVKTTGDGVITDPDAVAIPVGVTRWVYTKRTGLTPQTAQVKLNYANENALMTGNGFAVSQLTIPSTGSVTAALQGLVYAIAAADAATVPAIESQSIRPIRRGDLFLTWLAAHGAIDVTQFSVSIANALAPVFSGALDPPSNFPDLMEFGDPQVAVTGSVPHRVLKQSDIAALLAASTFSAKARWKTASQIGATGRFRTLWCEMPACQYDAGEADPVANTRRRGHSFNFFAGYDEASGFDVKFTVLTDVTSVATYT